MGVHETAELLDERRRTRKSYHEFLRVPSMSCGVYELPQGSRDLQSPHSEDEVYYVVSGRAKIRVGAEERTVRPGTIVFVPAYLEHGFHDIQEDLAVLVFFAPAEGTRSESARSAVK